MELRLRVPDTLAGQDARQIERLALASIVVRLYSLGDLSSCEGAKLLGMSRRELLDLLGKYHVSLFDDFAQCCRGSLA
jgi:predicted HTH domain antitoxin